MSDLGLTHIAFFVRDIEASIAFYARYADMTVVHRRVGAHGTGDTVTKVVWLSDLTRPFIIVLIEAHDAPPDSPLGPLGHIGVGVSSRADVDQRATLAETEGCLRKPPTDYGPPVGYWCYIADPDGNILELSYGQEVAFTVQHAESVAPNISA
jgi:catechol 2,3-dioxygenase-like lactoylglutathione lyase family enzyme